MLTLTLQPDGSLQVTSDDKHAENQIVLDLLEGSDPDAEFGEDEPADVNSMEAQLWRDAPFADGLLDVTFPANLTDTVLDKLVCEFPVEVDPINVAKQR